MFEDTANTSYVLKSHICNTSCIKISMILSIIKDWGISKSDQTIVCLEEWMLVNIKSFQVQMLCRTMQLFMQNYQKN